MATFKFSEKKLGWHKTATSLVLLFSLLASSCSSLTPYQWSSDVSNYNRTEESFRTPASELDSLVYYLYIDKFKYYINEYSVAMEGKIPDEIILHLRSINPEYLMKLGYTTSQLEDALKYDELLWGILQKQGLTKSVKKADLQWGYNFFKNKLNEAFSLNDSALKIKTHLEPSSSDELAREALDVPLLSSTEQTLDSNHYIANRNTQAIFWEANKNQRTIEFFLGDSREFLKRLTKDRGELVHEIKPLAKNYNKIFVVRYPNETKYRIVMTNIGGKDRLNHLISQLSLSLPPGSKVKAKMVLNGDINVFQQSREDEHVLQLKLLPKADRVIIGQKESIDGRFEIFNKTAAIIDLKENSPSMYDDILSKMSDKDRTKLEALLESAEDFEKLFNQKSLIESAFDLYKEEIGEEAIAGLAPKFKIYNFDNFTVEMSDYVFKSSEGKIIRWRVVSNVWGDEILPLAKALKRTGHTKITYMGTAGAFGGKGYKVGDLVSPKFVYDGDKKLPMLNTPMSVKEAQVVGAVEHVGSPFEEDQAWLKKVSARSEFVEVETSYLRRVFDSPKDELELFLLISDILGSETETLAHATSSKRKNSQTRLLATLFKRDTAGIPRAVGDHNAIASLAIKNKKLIFSALKDKSHAYRHFAFSQLKEDKALTAKKITDFVTANQTFTDDFLLTKLTGAGEVLNEIVSKSKNAIDFQIAFSAGLVDGSWNPKKGPLEVVLIAPNAQAEKNLQEYLDSLKEFTAKKGKDYKFVVTTMEPNSSFVIVPKPKSIDIDYFVRLYSYSAISISGIYRKVTYNGNVVLDMLPTVDSVGSDTVLKNLNGLKAKGASPKGVMPDKSCSALLESILRSY